MINLKYDQEQMDEFKDYVIGEAMRSALLSESNSWFAQLNGDLQLIFKAYTEKLEEYLEDQNAAGKWLISCAIRDKMALRIKLEIKRIDFIIHSARLQHYGISESEQEPYQALNDLVSTLNFEIKRHQSILQKNAASPYLTSNDIEQEIRSFMQNVPKDNIEQEIMRIEESERNGFNNA